MDEQSVAEIRELATTRTEQIEAEFEEALKAEEHLFDEEMFDRVPQDDAESGAATLTFTEESKLETEAAEGAAEGVSEVAEEGDAATEVEEGAADEAVAAASEGTPDDASHTAAEELAAAQRAPGSDTDELSSEVMPAPAEAADEPGHAADATVEEATDAADGADEVAAASVAEDVSDAASDEGEPGGTGDDTAKNGA
jgi:hypothetical protein